MDTLGHSWTLWPFVISYLCSEKKVGDNRLSERHIPYFHADMSIICRRLQVLA